MILNEPGYVLFRNQLKNKKADPNFSNREEMLLKEK